MEIILAKTAGFCFGVKRAVNLAFEHTGEEETYTFGPIIHNEVVIKSLKDQGISPIEDLNEQPAKQLIIRSHGVGPKVYTQAEEKGVRVIDATCPYVKRIHRYVQKYHDAGYGIIIVGNEMHPEVQGIEGWAGKPCVIVKEKEEIKNCTLDKQISYLVVAQTTYKKEVVEAVLDALKAQKITFEFINTICTATRERQDEAAHLAQKVDAMLILGSQKSSNTLKLYEISKAHCQKSYCIEGEEMLTEEMIRGCKKVGITAGASTPQSVIEAVIEKLNHIKN